MEVNIEERGEDVVVYLVVALSLEKMQGHQFIIVNVTLATKQSRYLLKITITVLRC